MFIAEAPLWGEHFGWNLEAHHDLLSKLIPLDTTVWWIFHFAQLILIHSVLAGEFTV